MSVAPSITWLLVRIVPSEVTITPEPRLCSRWERGCCCCWPELIAEKLAEERIVEERRILAPVLHNLRGTDVYDCRQHRLQDRSETIGQAAEQNGVRVVRHCDVQSRSAKNRAAAPVPQADIQHDASDNRREDHNRGHPAADTKFALLIILSPFRSGNCRWQPGYTYWT